MEKKQVPFIDRIEELETIARALQEWDSRYVVFVQGDGGVGKTRFIREAVNRLKDRTGKLTKNQYQERSIKIGVLILTGLTGWGKLFLQGCQAMSEDLGIQLIVEDAGNNLDEMAFGLDRLRSLSPDAIIIDLGRGDELQKSVNAAIDEGIRIITVSSDLVGDEIVEIAQDEFHIALLSLQPIIEELDGEGKILSCWHAGPAPLESRKKILDEEIKKYPKINIVAYIGSRPESGDVPLEANPGENIVEQIVDVIREHPDLKAIWASYGEYGLAAMQALEITGRLDINLYSIDFDERIQDKMRRVNSPWRITVASNPMEIGKIAIRVSARAVYGDNPRRKYFTPINVISSEIVQAIAGVEAGKISGWDDGSGVGWSPWLREITTKRGYMLDSGIKPELLRSDDIGQSWLFLNILDLDDARLHSPQDLAIALVNQLGEENFRSYNKALQNLRSTEIKNPSQYENYRKVVDELFLQTLAGLSFGHRTVILCDTTDALKTVQKKNLVNYLLRIIDHLSNSIMIIAGRNTQGIKQEFDQNRSLVQTLLIHLKPFDQMVSKEYFDAKQDILNVQLGLEKKEIEKIILLSRGLPIQIDMAVDWLTKGLSRTWLTQDSLENLMVLSEVELESRRVEFESQLVLHIERLRQQQDRLILALAWVNPMGPDLCSCLIKISLEDAEKLIGDVSELSFIKILPDGRIKLHDYVQDMIRKYVWPKIELDRRIYTSEQAAKYYDAQMNILKEKISTLPDSDVEKDVLLREYWQEGTELTFHTFYTSSKAGVEVFSSLFDEATRDYRIRLREDLVDVACGNLNFLSGIEKYPIIRRQVRHLVDTGRYEEARDVADEYLKNCDALQVESPGIYVDILTQVANCNKILGKLHQSRTQFLQAYEVCRKDKNLSNFIPGMENNIGQVLRLLGDLDMAEKYYLEAQKKTNNPTLIASIMNNLSYVVMLQGNFNRAINYCREALDIRQQHHLEREIGISHLTLGEIYRNWAKYEEATREYHQALAIFEREQDVYWLSQANVQLGSTYRILGKLDDAGTFLSRGFFYKVPIQEPYIFHALGCLLWDKGDKEQALKQLELSDKSAESLDLVQVYMNNLLVSAEIFYDIWVESNYTDINSLALIREKTKKFIEMSPLGFFHHLGRIWRLEADTYFDEGNYESAKDLYINAYKFLGIRKGGYGKRTFEDELKALEFRIVERLGRENEILAMIWCRDLREKWEAIQDSPPSPWKEDLLDLCDRCERKLKVASSRPS